MAWDPEHSLAELKSALLTCDWERAADLVRAFTAHVHQREEPYPEADAREVVTALRRKRQFQLMRAAADALILSGNGTFRIRQDYAQALLDLGMLAAARAVIEPLVCETAEALQDPARPIEERGRAGKVHVQARGLLGRMYKQWYDDANAPQTARSAEVMTQAIAAYWDTYREHPADVERRWHGVNAVALARRAQEDRLGLSLGFVPETLADALVDAVREKAGDTGRPSFWDCAVAMEASLARKDGRADALHWAQRYIADPELDAFEIASTRRQLEEVWRHLPSDSPREELIGLLDARLLRLPGGRVDVSLGAAAAGHRHRASLALELDAGSGYAEHYGRGIERAMSVARIELDDFVGMGSGVVVRGGDLFEPLGDKPVLLTAAHVLCSDLEDAAQRAARARVSFSFGRTPGQAPFRTTVSEVIWPLAPSGLDACVLGLADLPEHVRACRLAKPEAPEALLERRVCLAGYPRGASLRFSFVDNVVVDGDERALYYNAETEKGSSGSPVFDERFELLAVHCAGRIPRVRRDGKGCQLVCEGVRVSAIASAVQQDLARR